jgi:hypothetical protein
VSNPAANSSRYDLWFGRIFLALTAVFGLGVWWIAWGDVTLWVGPVRVWHEMPMQGMPTFVALPAIGGASAIALLLDVLLGPPARRLAMSVTYLALAGAVVAAIFGVAVQGYSPTVALPVFVGLATYYLHRYRSRVVPLEN